MRPKTIILRTAGTNCDKETAFAFEAAGASAELVHINLLAGGHRDLEESVSGQGLYYNDRHTGIYLYLSKDGIAGFCQYNYKVHTRRAMSGT